MKLQRFQVLVVLFQLSQVVQSISQPVTATIDLDSGKVVGLVLTNFESGTEYSSFKGIPYGKILERFQPAVNVDKWPGEYEAFTHGPICLQYKDKVLLGAEDCLYLNVYTPQINFNFNPNNHPRKAVMVWIHGGMFQKGSGNSDSYGPDFIVARDVILVTINYRLASLGFLNLHHPKIPGNAGLKDQNLALKWVKRNIAKFGGDPDNVTIFGQSAGAVSVDLHVMTEMSRGLFNKSIALSGSIFCPWAFSYDPLKKAKKFAQSIGNIKKNDDLVKKFLESPIEKLIRTHTKSSLLKRELEFCPSIENSLASGQDAFIDDCFEKSLIHKTFYQGDHILGYTSQEAKMFTFTKFIGNKRLDAFSLTEFMLPIDLKQQYYATYGNMNVYYYYFGFNPQSTTANSGIYTKSEILSTIWSPPYFWRNPDLNCGIRLLKLKLKQKRLMIKIHFFHIGVGHSKDLKYLFYKAKYYPTFTSQDLTMRDHYATLFTNFAKYGNPSIFGKSPFTWTVSNKDGNYLNIDASGTLSMRSGRPVDTKEEINLDNKESNFCSNYKQSLKDAIQLVFFGKKLI